jgi:hypothetical protein
MPRGVQLGHQPLHEHGKKLAYPQRSKKIFETGGGPRLGREGGVGQGDGGPCLDDASSEQTLGKIAIVSQHAGVVDTCAEGDANQPHEPCRLCTSSKCHHNRWITWAAGGRADSPPPPTHTHTYTHTPHTPQVPWYTLPVPCRVTYPGRTRPSLGPPGCGSSPNHCANEPRRAHSAGSHALGDGAGVNRARRHTCNVALQPSQGTSRSEHAHHWRSGIASRRGAWEGEVHPRCNSQCAGPCTHQCLRHPRRGTGTTNP